MTLAPSFAEGVGEYASLTAAAGGVSNVSAGAAVGGASAGVWRQLLLPAEGPGGRGGDGLADEDTESTGELAEDLCVVSLVTGLTAGAFLAWVWLLLL
eukprot:364324-Chlamydomonas_euryale.AAC.4